MWVSPWCCLSVLSLEESSPKANNTRRKGRQCVEELAGVFLKPAQSVCSCPGFPEALFRSVQPEAETWAEPEGGVPSVVACHGRSRPRGHGSLEGVPGG